MVRDGNLVVIDFQDARLGPATYDLVSLLRDCYVELPDTLSERLLHRYLTLAPSQAGAWSSRYSLMARDRARASHIQLVSSPRNREANGVSRRAVTPLDRCGASVTISKESPAET